MLIAAVVRSLLLIAVIIFQRDDGGWSERSRLGRTIPCMHGSVHGPVSNSESMCKLFWVGCAQHMLWHDEQRPCPGITWHLLVLKSDFWGLLCPQQNKLPTPQHTHFNSVKFIYTAPLHSKVISRHFTKKIQFNPINIHSIQNQSAPTQTEGGAPCRVSSVFAVSCTEL